MATSFLEVLNRAFSTLDGAIDNSVTTVNVAAGEGGNFPSSFDYHVTVGSEIMKVTARSTDALTVTRGAESSTPASHSDGDTIAMVITAQHLSDLNTAVRIENIAGSTFSSIQHMQDIFHSAGWVSGGGITDDADGTITVAAGTGLIRDVDGATETIFFTDWAAEAGANVNLADNDINYVYVEYTGGSPAVFARTTESTDYNTKILLAIIQRTGTTLHINTVVKHTVGDHSNSMIRRMKDTMAYAHVSGGILSATGTRNVALTAGSFWEGLTAFTTAAFDSSGADTFAYWYRKVSDSGWNEVTGVSPIHQTNYDDNSGTLATLSSNKYGVHWVYLMTDDAVAVVYGQGDYTLSEAQDAQPPGGLPEPIEVHAFLVGKIVIKKSAAAFTQVESAFEVQFTGSFAASHGDLADLGVDDHTQYLLADGSRALAGAWDMADQSLTNVNIDSGRITGIIDLAIQDGGTGAGDAATARTNLDVGPTPESQEFTGSGNWTKPTDGVTFVLVEVTSAGGGGGSGRVGAAGSVRLGGSGGGSGATIKHLFLASELGATESVTIGAAGGGGAAQTTNSTNGNAGSDGGDSLFGGFITSPGGGGGEGGDASSPGVGGGGALDAPANGGDISPGAGGGRAGTSGTEAGNSAHTTGAGGAGGTIDTDDGADAATAGGDRSIIYDDEGNSVPPDVAGGAAGTSGGSPTAGANGATEGEGAGGGGASHTANSGAGGVGLTGGGGGGSGAATDGQDTGAGGNGGAGLIRVLSW